MSSPSPKNQPNTENTPLLADSHCHLHMLKEDSAAVVARAREQGVQKMLCVACEPEDIDKILPICEQENNIAATVGLHPNYATNNEPDADTLAKMADNPHIAAIGETGLDTFRTETDEKTQELRLRQHVRAARQCGKPLVIHCRDAWERTIELLREEKAHEVGGVMHCFTGNLSNAEKSMEMGFMISFSGIVTFKNAKQLQDVAKLIPSDMLLLETDCPYLAPEPHRGKGNEPAMMVHTAKKLAELQQIELDELAQHTTDNYCRLFRQ